MPVARRPNTRKRRTPTGFLRQLAHAERRPEVLPYRERESFRHDSDHRRLRRSEPHDTTYHRRIRAESHLPEAVPQNDDRGRLRETRPHPRARAPSEGERRSPRNAAALISAASTGSPTCSPTIRFRWTNRNAPMSSTVRSPSRQLRTS